MTQFVTTFTPASTWPLSRGRGCGSGPQPSDSAQGTQRRRRSRHGPAHPADLVRRRRCIIRHDHQRDAIDVLECPPVGISQAATSRPDTRTRTRARSMAVTRRTPTRRPARRSGRQLHPGARPINLHRVPRRTCWIGAVRSLCARAGDDLAEPFVPVVAAPGASTSSTAPTALSAAACSAPPSQRRPSRHRPARTRR